MCQGNRYRGVHVHSQVSPLDAAMTTSSHNAKASAPGARLVAYPFRTLVNPKTDTFKHISVCLKDLVDQQYFT